MEQIEASANTGERDATIDVAKGICILLVICIHTEVFGFVPMPFTFIAVPMFFFMSGCFDRSNRPFLYSFSKNARTLLLPALIWTCFGLAYSMLLKFIKGEPFELDINLYSLCSGNGPCWFLVTLFWTRLFIWLLVRLCRRNWIVILSVSILGWVGFQKLLPFYIDDGLGALPLYYAGKMSYALYQQHKSNLTPFTGGVLPYAAYSRFLHF